MPHIIFGGQKGKGERKKAKMDGEMLIESVGVLAAPLVHLDYYIIWENISAMYCDLKRYGIKVERISLYEGGGKIIETKQIGNIFYRESDVREFVAEAARHRVEPYGLVKFTERYIARSLDRARQKI